MGHVPLCAYGDILPKTDTGRIIAALCSGTGYLFFIFVCLTAFIASRQPAARPLRPYAPP